MVFTSHPNIRSVDIFLYGIIVPVLPFALNARASVAEEDIQTWISIFLAVYGAALLIASPFFGWLADKIASRRWPMLAGLLALGGSTVLLCVGRSVGVLIAGRILQGVSAAVAWVVGLALLVDTLGAEQLGMAMGYVGLALSLALLLAPLLGGIVFAQAGYYAVFAMGFGIIILDIILRLVMIEKKVAERWLPINPPPAVNISDTDIEKQTEITKPGSDEPDIELDKGSHGTNDALLTNPEAQQTLSSEAPKVVAEDSKPHGNLASRLPPVISLLKSRRLLCALWLSAMQASLMTSFDATLPLFVANTFGWDSTGAGLIFLPIVIATFVGPVIGWASDRFNIARWLVTSGFVLAVPFLILLRLVDHDSIGQKVLLCALLCMIGLGLTLALTPIMAEIAYVVDAKEKKHPPGFFGKNGAYASAYSLFNMAWAAGCLIGPLLGGLVNSSKGWPTMTLILGCVSAFSAIPAVIWTSGSLFKLRRKAQAEFEPRQ
jgi:MFS family permease